MVVDAVATHPYQAEVLLHTLRENAAVPPEAVVVQCTTRVDEDVAAHFRRSGHAVTRIAPYLDGRYCNKIAQLDCFAAQLDAGVEGVFLLDLDLAIAAPLRLPDPSAACGKVVDGDNPNLALIEKLFQAAGVPLPEVVPSDWEGRGDTVATNLNGGFVYLPRRSIAPLRAAWRKWAEFLFARPTLFGPRAESEAAFKHVDQLALALALASEHAPLCRLPTNWNFPCHKDRRPRLYRQHEPLRALHYHDCLDEFGLLAPTVRGFEAVDDAAKQVNAGIGAGLGGTFFDLFKQERARETVAQVPALPATPFSAAFRARKAVLPSGKQRRLILHAGTPKTGTSSLQRHLGEHRRELASQGWWYPPPSDTPEPKHQRLNALLRRGNAQSFAAYVEEALRDMPDSAHTVLFTTEGIYNHWWDYEPWAKAALRHLAALFDFELCVWFRPPVPFAAALYVQYLANPPTEDEPRHVYGRDIDFATALADPWFRRHFDYLGFLHEARELFGAARVRPFLFGDDTVQTFIDAYGVPLPAAHQRRNRSIGELGARMLRVGNRLLSAGAERDHAVALVRDVDTLLGEQSAPFVLDEHERNAVLRYAQRGWSAVQAAVQSGRGQRAQSRTGSPPPRGRVA